MVKHHYHWKGVDRQGRLCTGALHANAPASVVATLQKERIRVIRIQRQWNVTAWIYAHQPKQRMSTRDVTQLTRQLATLLRAGIPLLQAFDVLNRGENHTTFKTLTRELHAKIEGGMALNHALREHPEFDALYCNLVAVGELAGMLDTMLERLAHHLEKSEALRTNVRSALIYPAVVLGIASIAFILILVFVVPVFQNIFASFGAELPGLTRAVIAMSEGLGQYGHGLLVFLFAIVWWLRREIHRRHTWQRWLHRLLLQTPVAGPLTRDTCTARWTRALATLFSAGVPLTDALEALQDVTGNLMFQEATQDIQTQLMQGRALSQALHRTQDLFPSMVSQMCAIGEESGSLDRMLEKTAEHFEHEVDDTVARLSTLLEPFIMVVLGLLIGGLVMALYLPIFQLGQVV